MSKCHIHSTCMSCITHACHMHPTYIPHTSHIHPTCTLHTSHIRPTYVPYACHASHMHPTWQHGAGGEPQKNINTLIFSRFGASKATTAIGEAIATDSLSMGPNRGMATRSASIRCFPGLFLAAPAAQNRPGGRESGLEA